MKVTNHGEEESLFYQYQSFCFSFVSCFILLPVQKIRYWPFFSDMVCNSYFKYDVPFNKSFKCLIFSLCVASSYVMKHVLIKCECRICLLVCLPERTVSVILYHKHSWCLITELDNHLSDFSRGGTAGVLGL